MTDEELIARLRNYGHVGTVLEAADRIEALVKERDAAVKAAMVLDDDCGCLACCAARATLSKIKEGKL